MSPLDPNHSKLAREAWLRALQRTAPLERHPVGTLPLLIERWAQERGEASALETTEHSLSYRGLAERCHRYARWGMAQGLGPGDVVALLMPNGIEYLPIWLGLTRIGVTVALVNTQLSGEPLAHSLRIVAPRLIIVDCTLAADLAAVRAKLVPTVGYWVQGHSREDFTPLGPAIERGGADPLSPAERPLPTLDALALYIYTSGTTGLPKAARVSHYRIMQWTHWFAGMMDIGRADRMYDCLPLYHSVGGVVACGSVLVAGGAVVLRERFSASDFWRDVSAQRCTLFQYIGELCRYLVNAPPVADETGHSLRLACGNGLRPEIWPRFQARFRIPRILEYYASTEGNFSLYNCEGQPGAIGRIPGFLSSALPVALLRFDVEREQPLRNATGRCERCAVDEVGEAVGRVPPAGPTRAGRFEGYGDAAASAAKLLHDVFTAGDVWYRTGDLMCRDARGFYYFVDRVGDTFRWKGENVSTTEVWAALVTSRGVLDGVVYGVAVPGTEGRAGMAALVTDRDFDLAAFHAHAARSLPRYARPQFLRLLPKLELTATFKLKKRELSEAGFDPAKIPDPLYIDDARAQGYVVLDDARYADLIAGVVRL